METRKKILQAMRLPADALSALKNLIMHPSVSVIATKSEKGNEGISIRGIQVSSLSELHQNDDFRAFKEQIDKLSHIRMNENHGYKTDSEGRPTRELHDTPTVWIGKSVTAQSKEDKESLFAFNYREYSE